MPTPDEAIDAITDAWMTVTSDIPEDADPEAVEESLAR